MRFPVMLVFGARLSSYLLVRLAALSLRELSNEHTREHFRLPSALQLYTSCRSRQQLRHAESPDPHDNLGINLNVRST